MKPKIFDPAFRYTRSEATDIRKRFAAELRRIAAEKKAEEERKAAEAHKIESLFRKRA